MKGALYELDLSCTKIKDDQFGAQSKLLINIELGVVSGLVKGLIEGIFAGGLSLQNIFADTAICWLDVSQIYFIPTYNERFLWGGLTVGYSTIQCPTDKPFGDWTVKPIKDQLAQIGRNIMGDI